MLFKCTNCGVEFSVDPSKVPNPNVRFKCVRCKKGYLVRVDTKDSEVVQQPVSRAAGPLGAGGPAGKPSGIDARQLITNVKDLPSLPFVATKVMELTASPTTGMKEMEEVISMDSALAAKVLRYSNSALYGRAQKIATLNDALVLLGFSTVKTIVIASSVKSILSTPSLGYCAGRKTLWAHCVETAIAARLLAARKQRELIEEAFVVGLLHDIGKSVVETKLPGMVQQIVSIRRTSGQTFEEIERKVLGIDHSQIGAALCRKWNFPEILEKGILYHHRPGLNKKLPVLSHLAMVADTISYHLALPTVKRLTNVEKILQLESSQFFGIEPKELEALVAETEETVQRDRKIFEM